MVYRPLKKSFKKSPPPQFHDKTIQSNTVAEFKQNQWEKFFTIST